jgi:hypothetical protein
VKHRVQQHPGSEEEKEAMTLEQALAYLTPHPSTNGPVHLNPEKMREAIAVIRAALGV